jgi:hypothetical protein
MAQTPRLPAALGYQNGYLPDSMLVPVQGQGLKLWGTAADQYLAMVAAAAADGVEIRITDAYRSFESQVELKKRKPTLSATPGTSEHGWGEAIDVDVGKPGVLAWLRRNAARYGFANTVSHENWHWGWIGGATVTGTGGAVSAARTPIAGGLGFVGDVAGDAAGALTGGIRKVFIYGVLIAGGVVLVAIGADRATGKKASSAAVKTGAAAAGVPPQAVDAARARKAQSQG